MAPWYVLPAVASAPGALGAYFRSDVTIVNPDPASPLQVDVLLVTGASGTSGLPSATVTVPAGSTVVVRDAVAALFGHTGGASLILQNSSGRPFGCSSWTYTGTSGSYGFAGGGHDWAYSGRGVAYQPGLRNGGGFRANLGAVSVAAVETTVEVNVYGASGKLGTRRVTLPPFGRVQFPVSEIAPEFENAYAVWTGLTDSHEAYWLPFATVIDNASGDSVFASDLDDYFLSAYPATWNLGGVWRGTLTTPAGARDVTADVWQTGGRIELWLYDTPSGAMLVYSIGREENGTLAFVGQGSLFQCLSSEANLKGGTTDGRNLSLSLTGSGCFADGGSVSLQLQPPSPGLAARPRATPARRGGSGTTASGTTRPAL